MARQSRAFAEKHKLVSPGLTGRSPLNHFGNKPERRREPEGNCGARFESACPFHRVKRGTRQGVNEPACYACSGSVEPYATCEYENGKQKSQPSRRSVLPGSTKRAARQKLFILPAIDIGNVPVRHSDGSVIPRGGQFAGFEGPLKPMLKKGGPPGGQRRKVRRPGKRVTGRWKKSDISGLPLENGGEVRGRGG